ncbi:unnamed protein product [Rotaria socialis]|uniref:Replication protein A OB domain-containing protein n=1 Tax=Rotaria socialis TaxID=392032 RepID=A0A821AYF0_9BILA|nr:unnamed protein product [Rotaria socialis]CAF4416360.1 unnamed protein product [Rotaria socialis]CAF4492364.1 unnamed protein product [Rotaria socialis]CAF4583022.1 unnamed protein product [Rotaria socialis]CAF4838211.1 unnamed protein product [Rotaria socialis]
MALNTSSISRLMHGNIDDLPLVLQDIHQLNGDVNGVFWARLKLSDGENDYRGFVIDISLLNALNVDIFAIVRIEKLIVLKHPQGKYVLQVIEMHLISHEEKCIANSQAYPSHPTQTSTIISTEQNSHDCTVSSGTDLSILESQKIPIVQLSAPTSKNIVIEGRVIRKSELCIFANGKGKVFTFDIADFSSEIRCKAFNYITEIFFEAIAVGQAYQLRHFVTQRSNRQYNHLSHNFEISLTTDSVVQPICSDLFQNLNTSFNVVKISSISLSDVGKCVDLSVTINSIGDNDFIYVQKRNSFFHRRVVMVSDDSSDATIVFWGDLAKSFSAQINQNILLRELLVQCFKGQLQFATTNITLVSLNNKVIV